MQFLAKKAQKAKKNSISSTSKKPGEQGFLVLIDHFTEYAKTIPCEMEKNTPQATVRLLLTRWFAQNGTLSNLQSDKGTQFAADLTPKDVR